MIKNWTKQEKAMLEDYKQLDDYYREKVRVFIDYCSLQQKTLQGYIEDPRTIGGDLPGEECCTFCGKKKDQVEKMVAGPRGGYICEECVEVCNEILKEEFPE